MRIRCCQPELHAEPGDNLDRAKVLVEGADNRVPPMGSDCGLRGHGTFDLRRSGHSTAVGFIGRLPLPKGSEQDHVMRRCPDEWAQAVKEQGGFAYWRWDGTRPREILDIVMRHTPPASPEH